MVCLEHEREPRFVMMKQPEMQNCPCGGEPELHTSGLSDYVYCTVCGKKGPEITAGEEYAVLAWNEMCHDISNMENGF